MSKQRTTTLKKLREAKGITQAQVAKAMGVSQARVATIENSPLETHQIKTIIGFIKALGGELYSVISIKGIVQKHKLG